MKAAGFRESVERSEAPLAWSLHAVKRREVSDQEIRFTEHFNRAARDPSKVGRFAHLQI